MTKGLREKVTETLARPYQRILVPDEDGGFTASIQEFPGCIAEGDTPAEAYENLERTAEDWLEATLEQGLAVPTPMEAPEFSGRVVLRVPKSLHGQAVQAAENENVSLNTFLVTAVAERLGEARTLERLASVLGRGSTDRHLFSKTSAHLRTSSVRHGRQGAPNG